MTERKCSVSTCERTHLAKGYCLLHYRRARQGKPLDGPVNPRLQRCRDDAERFWEKVERSPGGCWIWVGAIRPNGYGAFSLMGTPLLAHRYSYELNVGPIPAGLDLDHLCRVRRCVNPQHLEPVTHAENLRRGRGAEVTRLRHQAARAKKAA